MKRCSNCNFDNEGNHNNYEEFFEKFVFSEGLQSLDKLHKPARIALRAIYAFEELGRYLNKVVHGIPLGRTCKYSKLLPQFQIVIDNYQVNAMKTGKCPNTIHSETVNGSAFFDFPFFYNLFQWVNFVGYLFLEPSEIDFFYELLYLLYKNYMKTPT